MTNYRERSYPQRYPITCAICGAEDSMLFDPSPLKQYYCRTCFRKIKAERAARILYPATCTTCGEETQVPFKPDGVRPVYCSTCYHDMKQNNYVEQTLNTSFIFFKEKN